MKEHMSFKTASKSLIRERACQILGYEIPTTKKLVEPGTTPQELLDMIEDLMGIESRMMGVEDWVIYDFDLDNAGKRITIGCKPKSRDVRGREGQRVTLHGLYLDVKVRLIGSSNSGRLECLDENWQLDHVFDLISRKVCKCECMLKSN